MFLIALTFNDISPHVTSIDMVSFNNFREYCLFLKRLPQRYGSLFQTENMWIIQLFKVNNKNTRKRGEICSKLTIMTPERLQWRSSGVFIINLEHIPYLFLVLLLLTLSRKLLTGLRLRFKNGSKIPYVYKTTPKKRKNYLTQEWAGSNSTRTHIGKKSFYFVC